MKKTHNLKYWSEYFKPVLQGLKTAELRINDRNFQVGDYLLLQEYNFKTLSYTNRELLVEITHITNGTNHLKESCVMLSFKILKNVKTLREKLLDLSKKEIEKTQNDTWYGKPERWYDNPTWRCLNNHVSKTYLKSEEKGSICLKCYSNVYLTFPEDKDGELCLDM
jgi:hypothetical protein